MTNSKNGTSGGVELTDELLGQLAKEAEEGYPVERVRPRSRRGRPSIGSKAAVAFQVRLEPDLHDALKHAAQEEGTSPSELARRALRAYLSSPADSPEPSEPPIHRTARMSHRPSDEMADRHLSGAGKPMAGTNYVEALTSHTKAAWSRSDDAERPGRHRPTVFLSYAHDSTEHEQQVKKFAQLLIAHGVVVVSDLWTEASSKNLSSWIANAMFKSDFIVAVASPEYRYAGDSTILPVRSREVHIEAAVLRDRLFSDPNVWVPKLLPVILPGRHADEIPLFLRQHMGDRYPLDEVSVGGIASLLHEIDSRRLPIGEAAVQNFYLQPDSFHVPDAIEKNLNRVQQSGKTELPSWQSRPTERAVLVVVHTAASLMRLQDITALLDADPRLSLEWTVVPDLFNRGISDLPTARDLTFVPWEAATRGSYDMSISSSPYRVDVLQAKRRVAAPHGHGYGKNFPSRDWPNDDAPPVYGLDRQSLLDRNHRPIFDRVVLSHTGELKELAKQYPEAKSATVIAGDLAFDRLLASLPMRERYRRDYGVRRSHILVVVASTWGSDSLLARLPDLPARLLRELPADHRVVMTMHPAVWREHGRLSQIGEYLREAREAGLDLIGPGTDWRPLLAAADVVIGDHTSLSTYAAAMGVPLLLSPFSKEEVVSGSAMAELAKNARWLDTSAPLASQLTAARKVRAAQQTAVLSRVSSMRGDSARILRAELYKLLGLSEPESPPRIDAVPSGELYPMNPV